MKDPNRHISNSLLINYKILVDLSQTFRDNQTTSGDDHKRRICSRLGWGLNGFCSSVTNTQFWNIGFPQTSLVSMFVIFFSFKKSLQNLLHVLFMKFYCFKAYRMRWHVNTWKPYFLKQNCHISLRYFFA